LENAYYPYYIGSPANIFYRLIKSFATLYNLLPSFGYDNASIILSTEPKLYL
jgi:hypothetical protein